MRGSTNVIADHKYQRHEISTWPSEYSEFDLPKLITYLPALLCSHICQTIFRMLTIPLSTSTIFKFQNTHSVLHPRNTKLHLLYKASIKSSTYRTTIVLASKARSTGQASTWDVAFVQNPLVQSIETFWLNPPKFFIRFIRHQFIYWQQCMCMRPCKPVL